MLRPVAGGTLDLDAQARPRALRAQLLDAAGRDDPPAADGSDGSQMRSTSSS